MIDPKKMIIVKLVLFLGIVIVSGYLWFFKGDAENIIYTDGTIVLEKSNDTKDKDSEMLFSYYKNILEKHEEEYCGILYTDLIMYFNNDEHYVYLVTDNAKGYKYGCYAKDSYCIYENDKFYAIKDEDIIDVTEKMVIYYAGVTREVVNEETEIFQKILEYLQKDIKGEFSFGEEDNHDSYLTSNKEYLELMSYEENWYISYKVTKKSKDIQYFKITTDLVVEKINEWPQIEQS